MIVIKERKKRDGEEKGMEKGGGEMERRNQLRKKNIKQRRKKRIRGTSNRENQLRKQ